MHVINGSRPAYTLVILVVIPNNINMCIVQHDVLFVFGLLQVNDE